MDGDEVMDNTKKWLWWWEVMSSDEVMDTTKRCDNGDNWW